MDADTARRESALSAAELQDLQSAPTWAVARRTTAAASVRSCTFCWGDIPMGAGECPDCGLSVAEMEAEQARRSAVDRNWSPQMQTVAAAAGNGKSVPGELGAELVYAQNAFPQWFYALAAQGQVPTELAIEPISTPAPQGNQLALAVMLGLTMGAVALYLVWLYIMRMH